MKKLIPFVFLMFIGYSASSQVMNYLIPFNTQANYLRSLNYPDGVFTDSLLVLNGTTRWTSKRPAYTGGNGIAVSTGNVISTSKKQETFTGTTAGSGTYSVTYAVAYSVAPNVQANIINGSVTNLCRVTSSSTTGFTITTNNIVNALGLLPTYPTVNGLVVDVLVTQK